MLARMTERRPNRIGLNDNARTSMGRVIARGQRRHPFEDLYHFVLRCEWWQFFAIVSVMYFLANALFAVVYLLAPGAIANVRPGSFGDAFFFSVQTMATIGYGVMAPVSRFGHVVVSIEALVGTFAAALMTGVTFAKFARPTARIIFSRAAVICPRDGVPHLMFRMANWRLNQILEARLSVSLLVSERSREGDVIRRPRSLKLVRDQTPMFSLSWTVMHAIDADSPLAAPGALEALQRDNAIFILTLRGVDETLSTEVIARHTYAMRDVVPDARFCDVLTMTEDGTRVLDFERFHDTEPLPDARSLD